jgi:hypothetical protein
MFYEQVEHLARLGMTTGLRLGVDDVPIDATSKAPVEPLVSVRDRKMCWYRARMSFAALMARFRWFQGMQ